ncbi:MAG TPA: hypothetical protein VG847_13910 [Chitinophagaceae bacterium]|nr:hypothetical protein [Chitinophagaceae bacterium]
MILACSPYRTDRNLGKAYNEALALMNEGDEAMILMDYDVLILLPDQLFHIHEYVRLYPEGDMFVCWGSRTFPGNAQLYKDKVSTDPNINNHISIARDCYKHLYNVTPVKQDISGFLMVIRRRLFREIKFAEDLKCLGVDTLFSRKALDAGKIIYRMDGIYVWHTYRLEKGINDKKHLV